MTRLIHLPRLAAVRFGHTRLRGGDARWPLHMDARWVGLTLAVVAVATGVVLRVGMDGLLQQRAPYATFFPPITAAAILGGAQAGVAAVIMSAVVVHSFLVSDWSFGTDVGLALFLTSGAAIAGIGEMMGRARAQRADASETLAQGEALRAANDRLLMALAAGDLGAFDYDVAAGSASGTPAFRAIFGLSADVVVTPELILSLVVASHRRELLKAIAQLRMARGERRDRAEFQINRANDGKIRWIRAETLTRVDNLQPAQIIGLCRDVTRDKSVTALRKEKAQLASKLEAVAASAPGAICSFRRAADGAYGFAYASAAFSRLYGIELDRVRTDVAPLFDRIHPDDIARVNEAIEVSAQTGDIWRETFRYDHPEKGQIWVEGHSSPTADDDGAILWHGYLQDVTARCAAEAALTESNARARAILNAGVIGVMHWRRDGVVVDANDKMLEMIGFSHDDLHIGAISWRRLTPITLEAREAMALEELRASGATSSPYEAEFLRKDGCRLPVLIASAVTDAVRDMCVSVALDISDRRRAEVEAREQISSRARMIRSMAASLAHEMNQPLAATIAYTRAAKRLLAADGARAQAQAGEILDKVGAQIERAGAIVTRLREFIAHGEPDMTAVQLDALIEDVCEQARRDAIGPIRLRLCAADVAVLADHRQIAQVIGNLLRNARDAMERSSRRDIVVVSTIEASHLRVDVIDTGVGVGEDAEEFFKPLSTTKENSMGVGLSISRAIIEAHHGRIWARANPEGGAIVSFLLPVFEPPTDA